MSAQNAAPDPELQGSLSQDARPRITAADHQLLEDLIRMTISKNEFRRKMEKAFPNPQSPFWKLVGTVSAWDEEQLAIICEESCRDGFIQSGKRRRLQRPKGAITVAHGKVMRALTDFARLTDIQQAYTYQDLRVAQEKLEADLAELDNHEDALRADLNLFQLRDMLDRYERNFLLRVQNTSCWFDAKCCHEQARMRYEALAAKRSRISFFGQSALEEQIKLADQQAKIAKAALDRFVVDVDVGTSDDGWLFQPHAES
ncbi:hypothetical protein CBOM_00145 [Ceraceosorus bombacis]|uniref:Uncharacterized protein n=1 Tax=Ceraceosorus bombacis TaxID=401625 RepID=A0A0P1B873_9BASI|nr:hypothetical protein CBOM_00145 [Ceraceosorus bombacis]